MAIIKTPETIGNPLQESALNKKGLCDYVINVASGCLHGCTFCYVPSTPVIRARQSYFQDKGIENPQMDWGNYLLVREEIPEKLEQVLVRKRSWKETPSGKGVVLLCSGTDPYQNGQTAQITRKTVEVLKKYNKRIRILTRGLIWTDDLDILVDPNITVGMSLPYLDDELSSKIEPKAPPPSQRFEALKKGHKVGCRLYVAMAPTHPLMNIDDFKKTLEQILSVNPEVIFWEPINPRGSNGKRMLKAGLDFVHSISQRDLWLKYFVQQWEMISTAAKELGCENRIHIWPDQALNRCVDQDLLSYWWYRPTVEKWDN